MNKRELKSFENRLNKDIDALRMKQIDLNVDLDGDESDRTQGSFILDMAYADSNRKTEKLENLLYALSKIESGDFGVCEECGENIGVKRLKICPDAKYCVGCAEAIEKEERGYRQKTKLF